MLLILRASSRSRSRSYGKIITKLIATSSSCFYVPMVPMITKKETKSERTSDGVKRGTRLFSSSYEIKDPTELDALVQESYKSAVVIDFYATWCGPCKTLTPRLIKTVKAQRNVILKTVDVDAFPSIAEALRVNSLPTVMMLWEGKFVEQFSGVINEDECERFMKRASELSNSKKDDDADGDEGSDIDIQSKLEVALQGLAEGSAATSATQRDALIAFVNSKQISPPSVRADCYAALCMIELQRTTHKNSKTKNVETLDASIENAEELVKAAEQILVDAKGKAGSVQFSAPTIAARARLKLRMRAEEHSLEFEDHDLVTSAYLQNPKNFQLNERAALSSVLIGDYETACRISLELLKAKSSDDKSKLLAREIIVEVIDSINFGASVNLAERTRRRLASLLFA